MYAFCVCSERRENKMRFSSHFFSQKKNEMRFSSRSRVAQNTLKMNTYHDGITAHVVQSISNALMRVAQQIEPELVQMFLEFGADPNLRNVDGMNALDLPLDWAAGSLKTRDPEGKLMKIVQMLLDAGVEAKLVDNNGEPKFWDMDPKLEEFLKEYVAKNSKEKQSDE